MKCFPLQVKAHRKPDKKPTVSFIKYVEVRFGTYIIRVDQKKVTTVSQQMPPCYDLLSIEEKDWAQLKTRQEPVMYRVGTSTPVTAGNGSTEPILSSQCHCLVIG